MGSLKKILIVDDEPDILEFLSYNFRKKQFEVTIANNGVEGIEAANEFEPDVIISDVLMPKMDGIEMCRSLKKSEKLQFIPTIILSAINNEFKILNAMDSGADEFASKPIKFDDLLAIVNRMLEKKEFDYKFSNW